MGYGVEYTLYLRAFRLIVFVVWQYFFYFIHKILVVSSIDYFYLEATYAEINLYKYRTSLVIVCKIDSYTLFAKHFYA